MNHCTGKQPKTSLKGKKITFTNNFREHYLKKEAETSQIQTRLRIKRNRNLPDHYALE